MSQEDLRNLFSLLAAFRSEHSNRSEAGRIVLGEVAVLIVESKGDQR